MPKSSLKTAQPAVGEGGLPALSDAFVPPAIRGVADLTSFAFQGNGFDRLVQRIGGAGDEAARLYDLGIACQLDFRREQGLALQMAALEQAQVFRVAPAPKFGDVPAPVSGDAPAPVSGDVPAPMSGDVPAPMSGDALRLLALVGPGDLMVNTPLDFLTNHLNVRLDLLHVLPDRPLPPVIPDHDVAFFAHSEPDADMLDRLQALFHAWPRPALNDPAFLPAMARDALSQSLAGVPGLLSPRAVALPRSRLLRRRAELGEPPFLLRPRGSHAGHGLALIHGQADLDTYLAEQPSDWFYRTEFVDYAGADGLYRKLRVAFIDREPFLCHMAVSSHWMVHYLNAGMIESDWKRAQEEKAMACFQTGFARRHAAAFEALHQRLGFDYYSIDCAETRDGRLLVFEADSAAIIHMMDDPGLFPYKQPQMRRVFDAFGRMLARRARPVGRAVLQSWR